MSACLKTLLITLRNGGLIRILIKILEFRDGWSLFIYHNNLIRLEKIIALHIYFINFNFKI